MLDGCLEWQRDRLGTSPAIAGASGSYFEAQDAFGRWLEDECILDPILTIKHSDLLGAFAQWGKANGEAAPSAVDFAELVDRHPALYRTKTNGCVWSKASGCARSREAAHGAKTDGFETAGTGRDGRDGFFLKPLSRAHAGRRVRWGMG